MKEFGQRDFILFFFYFCPQHRLAVSLHPGYLGGAFCFPSGYFRTRTYIFFLTILRLSSVFFDSASTFRPQPLRSVAGTPQKHKTFSQNDESCRGGTPNFCCVQTGGERGSAGWFLEQGALPRVILLPGVRAVPASSSGANSCCGLE